MQIKSAQGRINAYERALQNFNIEFNHLKQKSFEQANQIASLKIQLEASNNQLHQSHLNYRSLQSQLNIAQDRVKKLKEQAEISDLKIEAMTKNMHNLMMMNVDSGKKVRDLTLQLAQKQANLRALNCQLNQFKIVTQSCLAHREQNDILLQQLMDASSEKAEIMRHKVELSRKIQQLQTKLRQNYQHFIQNRASAHKQQSPPNTEKLQLAEHRIHEMAQTIAALQETINQKNRVMARLDQQLYRGTNLKQFKSDQGVSDDATLKFVQQEIQNRATMLVSFREKYASMLILEKEQQQAYRKQGEELEILRKRVTELEQQRTLKQSQLPTVNNNEEILKHKRLHETQMRIRIENQKKIVELLIQNKALHQLLNESMVNYRERLDKMVKMIKNKEGCPSMSSEERYTTVEELVEVNRKLVQEVLRLKGQRNGRDL